MQNFLLRKKDGEEVRSFFPIIDMISFSIDPNVEWDYGEDFNSIQAFVNKKLKKGDTLMMRYGRFPNHKYLLGFGFTIEKPKMLPEKIKMKVPVGPNTNSTLYLNPIIILERLTEQIFSDIRNQVNKKFDDILDNEVTVLGIIREKCKSRLGNYAGPIEVFL
jgi:hypothetical protein